MPFKIQILIKNDADRCKNGTYILLSFNLTTGKNVLESNFSYGILR